MFAILKLHDLGIMLAHANKLIGMGETCIINKSYYKM